VYRRPEIETDEGAQAANLSASGSLWKDALIMRDDVSHSMWSQLEGRAVKGPATGQTLATYPFERTTYAAWKAKHPNTLVLKKDPRAQQRRASVYASYFADDEALGVFDSTNPDERLPGKALVLGFVGNAEQVALPMRGLRERGWVGFELDGEPVVCVFEDDTKTHRAFRMGRHGAAVVEGDGEERVIVAGDDRWQLNGAPLTAEVGALAPLVHTPVFWFAWVQGYPGTRIVEP
jgi:hypothetical protein